MAIFSPELTFTAYKLPENQSSSTDKERCLVSMIDLLSGKGYLKNKDEVFNKLIERESYMSTGIGRRIAIPHIRHSGVLSFKSVIYLLDNEIDFNSIDGVKVKLVVFSAIPDNEGERYMKVLSKISEFLRDSDNRELVFQSKEPDKLYEMFRRVEDEI